MATVKKLKKAQSGDTILKKKAASDTTKMYNRAEFIENINKGLKTPDVKRSSVKPTTSYKYVNASGDTITMTKGNFEKKFTKQKSGGSTPAWQRKEGKNPAGGLNAKGRASYNRANPGKPGLKAPQPQGGPRKKSFCARMSGMKKKLTSSKTANDPNSRINKSLRKWKC